MRYSTQIKPISHVKANIAALIDRITEEREPIIITQNGEAKAVLMDVVSYEKTQETLALLKVLDFADKEIESGQSVAAEEILTKYPAKSRSKR